MWIQIIMSRRKNSYVVKNEQMHDTDGAMNTNGIIDDMGRDVDSEGELEIIHEDSEDEEIKLFIYQRDVDKIL